MLSVSELKTAQDAVAWDEYVLNHPQASGYHLSAWRRIMEAGFGQRTFYLFAKDEEERIQGIFPLVFLASRLFGRFLVSIPYVNYGGFLVNGAEARDAMLKTAADLAKDLRVAHIELRQQDKLDLRWPVKQHKVSMRLELPGDFEGLWKRFSPNVRRRVRRAEKAGMTVRIGREELVADFYRVFCRNMRDLGTPVYAQKVFRMILDTFPNDARICAVYLGKRPMAAAFLYGFQQRVEIPWVAADRRYKHLAANMLLHSSAFEYACREGRRIFDLGRSTPDTGPYHFKEQWGAQAVPLHWYYWLDNGRPLPELSPRNPKYGLAIQVWRRLPIALTRVLGPPIVRNIP